MFVKGPVELLVEVVGRGAVPAPQPAPEVDVLSDLEGLSSRAWKKHVRLRRKGGGRFFFFRDDASKKSENGNFFQAACLPSFFSLRSATCTNFRHLSWISRNKYYGG